MGKEKQIIGEVSVEAKAGLYVDKKTFRTSMNLAAIHAQNEGLKGVVVLFDMDDIEGYRTIPLETDEQCERVWDAAFGREVKED